MIWCSSKSAFSIFFHPLTYKIFLLFGQYRLFSSNEFHWLFLLFHFAPKCLLWNTKVNAGPVDGSSFANCLDCLSYLFYGVLALLFSWLWMCSGHYSILCKRSFGLTWNPRANILGWEYKGSLSFLSDKLPPFEQFTICKLIYSPKRMAFPLRFGTKWNYAPPVGNLHCRALCVGLQHRTFILYLVNIEFVFSCLLDESEINMN